MDSFHHLQTPNHHHSLEPSKKRLAGDQLQILEKSFNAHQKLKAELKLELAKQLGVSPRQIAIWYQNRRARHKIQAKEHEYKQIRQELGNVLAENIRLEKEVNMLKHELNKARQMLALSSAPPATTTTTLLSGSASDDDHSYSYSPGNMTYNWLNISKFPGEELHACLTCPVNMLEQYVNNQSILTESLKPDQDTNSDCNM